MGPRRPNASLWRTPKVRSPTVVSPQTSSTDGAWADRHPTSSVRVISAAISSLVLSPAVVMGTAVRLCRPRGSVWRFAVFSEMIPHVCFDKRYALSTGKLPRLVFHLVLSRGVHAGSSAISVKEVSSSRGASRSTTTLGETLSIVGDWIFHRNISSSGS
ncbi:hypothetical protein F4778DRAFT_443630 [Xylariomycetidae sp. FL2044]|nr:hypothetical protein F4778DRAFT_443630 [Xylariomycetidae sp. FL2044]